MSSIMTNSAALTALQSLNNTNKQLEITQSRISTGYRVATASDNAAYWSIATSMKSDNKALSAVQDSLGLGAGKVDTAYTAINDVKDQVDEIKTKLVTARGASQEDQQKIATEIKAIQDQIKSSVTNANFAGSNLLQNDGTAASDLKIVASYNRTGATVTIDTINVAAADTQVLDVAGTGGIVGGLLAATFFDPSSAAVADTAIDTALGTVETALGKLATGAASLGAAKSRIDTQQSFLSNLSDSIDKGVGSLVDADMNKESTRLQALQVQQQLGIQALSIANGNSQSILSLFRG
ncbi:MULTISPECIES: flagellin [unclassified Mesorhizobium]|uniref:flagellin N-terminal helical domain-containing protein n=1 Tax=unclassified Mesorhizobium TaxID=325217 RepID=UPI000BAFD4F1|nr:MULTISPECIES: flagellin [unclassified Mesorhizobium]TGT56655.1 flagellin [Mesorhizobium sp. M00.F.Ca.ET.170.01.1.1]AZO11705.1 flagellin [Mesorhizobium sp. M3A.F.Ca.ET.080.04.2.1]PBB86682.1 flagellin [Mesorhizobium sp. WSM3876]RWB72660.1 MAG: flagellin [Mesorhizobium sp.]RWB87069.1 MAG: flagellin [Mesorhizobium sp.]